MHGHLSTLYIASVRPVVRGRRAALRQVTDGIGERMVSVSQRDTRTPEPWRSTFSDVVLPDYARRHADSKAARMRKKGHEE